MKNYDLKGSHESRLSRRDPRRGLNIEVRVETEGREIMSDYIGRTGHNDEPTDRSWNLSGICLDSRRIFDC